MIVELTTQTKEYDKDTKKITRTRGVLRAELDTSLAAQSRFERHFPNLAEREDLFGYSKRICEAKGHTAGAVLMSKLKMMYCWFDLQMNYTQFEKLFDFLDKEYMDILTAELHDVFTAVFESSSEKN